MTTSIAWATPINRRSAIGNFSILVTEELARRGYKVTIVRTESGDDLVSEPLPTALPVVSAEDCAFESFDLTFVNIGNYAPYHSQIVSVFARHAPIGIFHDAQMCDFAWEMAERHGLDLVTLPHFAEQASAKRSLVGSESRPVLATLASMCAGAVVHGDHYVDAVADFCAGPVRILPLCYPVVEVEPAAKAPTGPPVVLIFGMITPHKQPDRVLAALSRISRAFPDVVLHLAGRIEANYQRQLEQWARELALQAPVFHQYVSDLQLQALFDRASIVCCLRYPVTEGGSASLVTGLNAGKPMIVSNVASYARVPDALVEKISYGNSTADLAQALDAILSNPSAALTRAVRAKEWAKRQYSAPVYVDALEQLIIESGNARRKVALARSMAPAMVAPDGSPMLETVADVAAVLNFFQASQAKPK